MYPQKFGQDDEDSQAPRVVMTELLPIVSETKPQLHADH